MVNNWFKLMSKLPCLCPLVADVVAVERQVFQHGVGLERGGDVLCPGGADAAALQAEDRLTATTYAVGQASCKLNAHSGAKCNCRTETKPV